MSQNIQQIFTNNPASSMLSTDLIYLGRSPFAANDDFAITWANLEASISAVGTITAGTWEGGVIAGTYGGTGVNNGTNLLGYEGNISFIGAYSLQITLTGATSIQFPTGGILLNSNLTSADFYVGNASNIATGVAMSGDASLANTGAVTVSSIGGKAVTLGGSLTTSGAFGLTLTLTGATNVTLPTSGTLATTSQLPSSFTGSGEYVLQTSPTLITPILGVAAATSINFGGSALSSYAQSTSVTPTITFDTPGNLSVAYTTQVGVYSRIGNIISYHFVLSCTPTFTTSSGNLRISLPVTPSANAVGMLQFQASAFPSGTTSVMLQVVNGNTGAVVGVNGSATATAYISVTQATSGNALNITGSVTYLA